jgi:acetoin utilization protein AcuC
MTTLAGSLQPSFGRDGADGALDGVPVPSMLTCKRSEPAAIPLPRHRLYASEIFWTSRHARGHPLAIPRVSLAVDLCRALDWLPDGEYCEAMPATPDELARFHDRAYIRAVIEAERDAAVSDEVKNRYNLGVNGNPVYGEVFRRPAMACGASIAAAQQVADNGGIAFNPTGGTHHGLRARASGYCIFNDPVLTILALRDRGIGRIVYLDLDAHFGDGVQEAFAADDDVLTISVHEAGRWPMARGGAVDDGPGGVLDRAGGTALNLPVPAGGGDDEFALLTDEVILPAIEAATPDAIVLQCGCDALADDPMTRLALSNRALWRTVDLVRGMTGRLVVLGGGGYNPYAVGRCWAGIWGVLTGRILPSRLPAAATALLQGVRWTHRLGRVPDPRWLTTLADPPRPGGIRDEVRALARLAQGFGR